MADANGIKIHYAIYGQGSPVIFLHGGLANSDYWGNHRGRGAPQRDPDGQPRPRPLDARRAALRLRPDGRRRRCADDALKIPKADIVGWSDGGIIGIDLALRHRDRVGKVFAFAANTKTSGVIEEVENNPTFAAFIARAGKEYSALSATPKEYAAFVDQISKMWFGEPNWTDAELKTIDAPVLVVDGDHDEAIKRAHTEYIAATIPHAGLLILPNVSHFAFLQDPNQFNFAILHFLGDE